jgi:hypothetical protein
LRQADDLAGHGVQLVAVGEVLSQSSTHQQAVFGVYAPVATIEQCVNVRSQWQTVVEPVLAARSNRPNVCCLKHGRDARSRDRTAPVISVNDDRLERGARPVHAMSHVQGNLDEVSGEYLAIGNELRLAGGQI